MRKQERSQREHQHRQPLKEVVLGHLK
jgi:hypothetical protein